MYHIPWSYALFKKNIQNDLANITITLRKTVDASMTYTSRDLTELSNAFLHD